MRSVCLRAAVVGVVFVLAGAALGQAKSASEYKAPPKYSSPVDNRKVNFPTGIYDENADGWGQLRAAMEAAKKDNRRVLVMWGENGCGFCAYLSDLLWHESPGIRALLDTEYLFVPIDVSKTHTKHSELFRKYGATVGARLEDSPRLTVIDPVKDAGVGTLFGKGVLTADPMSVERVFNEEGILAFLEANKPPARSASEVMAPALKEALVSGKPILTLFTRPFAQCEECGRWEMWLDRPDVKKALESAFVVSRVDVSRTSGADAMLKRGAGKDGVSAPALVVLSDRGAAMNPAVVVERFPATLEGAKSIVAQLTKANAGKLSEDQQWELEGSFGNSVGTIGIAENAKIGAAVVGDDDMYYIKELQQWPGDLVGKRVRVRGKLVRRFTNLVDERGNVSAGVSHYQGIEGAQWEPVSDTAPGNTER